MTAANPGQPALPLTPAEPVRHQPGPGPLSPTVTAGRRAPLDVLRAATLRTPGPPREGPGPGAGTTDSHAHVDRPGGPAGPARSATGALAGAAFAAAAAFLALAVGVAGGREELSVDTTVARWLARLSPSHFYRVAQAFTEFGSPLVLVFAIGCLAWWAHRRGDRRLVAIVTAGPLLAACAAELVLKPLVDRQLMPGYTFPSGHATGAAALACAVTVAAFWHRVDRRWLIAAVSGAGALATALAVVRLGWHVATDSLGGLLLAPAVVLGVAAGVLAVFPAPRSEPFLRRRGRVLVACGAAAAVAAGFIPVGLVALSPGPVIDLDRAITVDGQPIDINGSLRGLTVRTTSLNVGRWVWHQLSESQDQVVARSAVIPPGTDRATYDRQQRQVFADASQVAAAVAERAAGLDVATSGSGAEVTAVAPGAPADGALRVGDVVTAVGSTPVSTVGDLRDAIGRAASAGGPITVHVTGPDGAARTETLVPAVLGNSGRAGIGVGAATAGLRVTLPTPVTVDAGEVGGPSAGLLTGLAVYDALSPDDVARGRAIAGTGTLDIDGSVGPIGGIEEKVRAAIDSGATLFLAPAEQAGAARRAAGGRIDVVGVTNFSGALAALRAA